MTRLRQPACSLCGAALSRASQRGCGVGTVCGGCAERLELDLMLSEAAACPRCGRHRELCGLMPCGRPQAEPEPVRPVVKVMEHARPRRVSGPERPRQLGQRCESISCSLPHVQQPELVICHHLPQQAKDVADARHGAIRRFERSGEIVQRANYGCQLRLTFCQSYVMSCAPATPSIGTGIPVSTHRNARNGRPRRRPLESMTSTRLASGAEPICTCRISLSWCTPKA